MLICFVSIPRWWIAARWTCANSRTPFVHGGAFWAPGAKPGRELDGVVSHTKSRQPFTQRACRKLVSPCRMWGSHPSLGLHSITNDQRLGPVPSIVQLSFDETCRPLPSLTGTGPVQHVALT